MRSKMCKCSRCQREKPITYFKWIAKKKRYTKCCKVCIKKRRMYDIRGERCGVCGNPPTQRDLDSGGRLTRYQGKKTCAECLCPDLTDEDILAFFKKVEKNVDKGVYVVHCDY